MELSGFSNSDWAEDLQDWRSTSGYTYRLRAGSISWKSRKQATVCLSSTEAKYKAMSNSCREGVWLRSLLCELKLILSISIPLHVNSAGAKALSKNPKHHLCTKHIDARFHFMRECIKKEKLSFLCVLTKEMLADMLTKPLPHVPLESHCLAIGVV